MAGREGAEVGSVADEDAMLLGEPIFQFGSRAVRYKGSDEAYAVNELYMKMKELISNEEYSMIKEIEAQITNSEIESVRNS